MSGNDSEETREDEIKSGSTRDIDKKAEGIKETRQKEEQERIEEQFREKEEQIEMERQQKSKEYKDIKKMIMIFGILVVSTLLIVVVINFLTYGIFGDSGDNHQTQVDDSSGSSVKIVTPSLHPFNPTTTPDNSTIPMPNRSNSLYDEFMEQEHVRKGDLLTVDAFMEEIRKQFRPNEKGEMPEFPANNAMMIQIALKNAGIDEQEVSEDGMGLSQLSEFLRRHGFYCITEIGDLQFGDIVFMENMDKEEEGEIWVIEDYEPETGICKKYDVHGIAPDGTDRKAERQPVLAELMEYGNSMTFLYAYRMVGDISNPDDLSIASEEEEIRVYGEEKEGEAVSTKLSKISKGYYDYCYIYTVESNKRNGKENHVLEDAFDGNTNTCWIIQKSGDDPEGEDTYVDITFQPMKKLSGICINNGVCSSEENYREYGRIKSFGLEINGEEIDVEKNNIDGDDDISKSFELKDERGPQYLFFTQDKFVKSIKITVQDLFPGNVDAWGISEVTFFTITK